MSEYFLSYTLIHYLFISERSVAKKNTPQLAAGAKGERSEHLCESRACSGVNTSLFIKR